MGKRHGGGTAGRRPDEGLTPEFARLITAFSKRARVAYGGHGFGARALRVDGRIFAMLDARGRFVVKLPRERAAALLAREQGTPFEPVPGRPMREWVVVTDPELSMRPLAQEAYEHVAGAAPRDVVGDGRRRTRP